MNIQGLQKLTLLDYPGHLAATIFTGGCNFRCPYCHNWSLVEGYFLPETFPGRESASEGELGNCPLMYEGKKGEKSLSNFPETGKAVRETAFPVAEILDFLKGRKGKLQGVCITGGEPLLHKDLPDFIEEIRKLGFKIKLDTNGSMPERLAVVLERGLLDYVAMDIKNCPGKYAMTAGLKTDRTVVESVSESKRLISACLRDWELRTTVVRQFHTVEDMDSMGEWMAGPHKFFLQNFRPGRDVPVRALSPFDSKELAVLLAALRRHVPSAEIRSE